MFTITDHDIEIVGNFKYLGVAINKNNDEKEEINA
jgi:hypothetical protein